MKKILFFLGFCTLFLIGTLSGFAATPVNCRLICGNLCYNQPYLKCVNGQVRLTYFDPKLNSLSVSEINQPKSYTTGSLATRTFTVENKLGRAVRASFDIRFQPVALIEYKSFDFNKKQTIILSEVISFSIGEKKQITVTVPTESATLSSNILVNVGDVDNPNVGISDPYYSFPFSIYDQTGAQKTCQGFTINTTSPYLCTDKLFVPLGAIGCTTNNQCGSSRQCVEYQCSPSLHKDTDPSAIGLLVASVYLQSDPAVVAGGEKIVTDELVKLTAKLKAIAVTTGSPRFIEVAQKKCDATHDQIIGYLQSIQASESHKSKTDRLLTLCHIDSVGFTHVFINFYVEGIADTELRLLTNTFYEGVLATGVYWGKGIFVSSLRQNAWPVMLHELTHSFGAPDLYTQNYVNGATYLWGNCALMKAEPFTLTTSLCPLELSYYKSTNAEHLSPHVATPNGEEVYKTGDTIPIQWRITGLTPQNNSIGLSVYDSVLGSKKTVFTKIVGNPVVGGKVSDIGSYNWTIPSTIPTGEYVLYVNGASGWDTSNASFSISNTVLPYIKSISTPVRPSRFNVVISGDRLTGSLVYFDGVLINPMDLEVSDSLIIFTSPSTWINGSHSLYLQNTLGQSNAVTFQVTGMCNDVNCIQNKSSMIPGKNQLANILYSLFALLTYFY